MDGSSFYLIVLMVCGVGKSENLDCQQEMLSCLIANSKADSNKDAVLVRCLGD